MVAQIDQDYRRINGNGATLRRLTSYALFEGRPATTRGQWFNPVVRRVLTRAMHTHAPTPRAPIFVLGVGRSGTTHLGKLLSAHREVGWLNEPKMAWNLALPQEDVSGFYAPHGQFTLTADDATPQVRTRLHNLFGNYLRTVRATRLVDKYPELTYRAGLLRAVFPDARIISIVRRPEDFVNSVASWNVGHQMGDQDWWGVADAKWHRLVEQLLPQHPDLGAVLGDGDDATIHERAAAEWIVGMRALMASPEIDHRIRFEALATQPERTFGDVLDVCHLSRDDRVMEYARVSTSSRLRTDPAEFGRCARLVAEVREALEV